MKDIHLLHTKNAKKYLESLIPKRGGKDKERIYKLDRIQRLLDLIGNPQNSFKSIHVGGTSGKGSTAYMAAAILKEAGYKTGLHVSPHLEKINERMQVADPDEAGVNGKPISDEEFTKLVTWIKPYVKKVEKEGLGVPTYFEVLVALSFQYFKQKKVDIAVVEVGLGGTLDATNVLRPEVAVITNVDLDHTEILGGTVEKIARDKAGIIKEGIEAITAATQKSVLEIIKKRCKEKNARLTIIGKNPNVPPLRLLGEHQKINAACAIAAVRRLKDLRPRIQETYIKKALQKIIIPGRLEAIRLPRSFVLGPGFFVILDGAHNPAKMKSLVAALKKLYPKKKFVFIFAAKKGKDAEAMLRLLAPIAEKFYFTRFQTTTDFGKNQSTEPKELVKILKKINPRISAEIKKTPRAVVGSFVLGPRSFGVCVTGSLYLVGEVRSLLVE